MAERLWYLAFSLFRLAIIQLIVVLLCIIWNFMLPIECFWLQMVTICGIVIQKMTAIVVRKLAKSNNIKARYRREQNEKVRICGKRVSGY